MGILRKDECGSSLVLIVSAALWLSGCGERTSGSRQVAETPEPGLRIHFEPDTGTGLKVGDFVRIRVESNPVLKYFEVRDHPSLACEEATALGNYRRSVRCQVRDDGVREISLLIRAENADEYREEVADYPVFPDDAAASISFRLLRSIWPLSGKYPV